MTTDSDARPAALGPDLSPDENAPYGYTIDPGTGQRRPKLKAGRPAKSAAPKQQPTQVPPSLEDLKQAAEIAGPQQKQPDRPPGSGGRRRASRPQRGARAPASKPEPVDVAPFRAGPIAKGMNRLYRKAGRLVALLDPEIGAAIISCTRKETDDDGNPVEDDITVGEAWEEIARTNPRIRAVLLTLLSGGAWTQLFMAHAPILLAILMKRGVQRLIPWHRVAAAVLSDDDGDRQERAEPGPQQQSAPAAAAGGMQMPPGLGALLGNLTEDDWSQVNTMMGAMMNGTAARVPAGSRAPVVDAPDVPDRAGGGP